MVKLSACKQNSSKKDISQDIELTANMYGKNMQVKEIYQIFRQRILLYENPSTMSLTEIDRLLLNSKQVELNMELKLFRFKQYMEEEISQVNSLLDELEVQLTKLKENHGTNIVNPLSSDIKARM